MAANLIDPLVVAAARAGDAAALDILLVACQPDLRRFARRTCKHADDAEDAVQEALWILSKRIGTIRTIAAFTGWLFQVVRRECIRLARKHLPIAANQTLDELPSKSVDSELRHDLVASILALDEQLREVFLMCEVEEFTGPEVSRALGVSLTAVKGRLHRARLQLMHRMSDHKTRI